MSYPTNTTLLDDFTTATPGHTALSGRTGPGITWATTNIVGSPWVLGVYDQSGNNVCGSGQDPYHSSWSTTTFGPDSEFYLDLKTALTDASYIQFYTNLIDAGAGAYYGYYGGVWRSGSTYTWEIGDTYYDYPPGSDTHVDVPFTSVDTSGGAPSPASGDSVGIAYVDGYLQLWHKPAAGSWTKVIEYATTIHTEAGSFALQIGDITTRVDDFRGGTSIEGPPPSDVRVDVSIGA